MLLNTLPCVAQCHDRESSSHSVIRAEAEKAGSGRYGKGSWRSGANRNPGEACTRPTESHSDVNQDSSWEGVESS